MANVSVASWGGTVLDKPYNRYSLLATIEDIFTLPLLGYAERQASPASDGSLQLQVLMQRKAAVMSTDMTAALPGMAG
jgi:hypothetical protein